MNKKLIILLVLNILIINIVSINADTDDFFPWTWSSSTTDLTIQIFSKTINDDSISDNWYKWNGIADNIYIKSCHYNSSNDDKDCDIKIYMIDLSGSTIGLTSIYTKEFWGKFNRNIASFSGKVDFAEIDIDEEKFYNYNPIWREKVFLHEIGHTLALRHPTINVSGDETSKALMHQMKQENWRSYTITKHDEDNLIEKWD